MFCTSLTNFSSLYLGTQKQYCSQGAIPQLRIRVTYISQSDLLYISPLIIVVVKRMFKNVRLRTQLQYQVASLSTLIKSILLTTNQFTSLGPQQYRVVLGLNLLSYTLKSFPIRYFSKGDKYITQSMTLRDKGQQYTLRIAILLTLSQSRSQLYTKHCC